MTFSAKGTNGGKPYQQNASYTTAQQSLGFFFNLSPVCIFFFKHLGYSLQKYAVKALPDLQEVADMQRCSVDDSFPSIFIRKINQPTVTEQSL